MVENSTFLVKVRLDPFKEKIEPIIAILNDLVGSSTNLDVLGVKGLYIFLFTPLPFKSLLQVLGGLEAPTWLSVTPFSSSLSE